MSERFSVIYQWLLESSQEVAYILLDASLYIATLSLDELLAYNVLVELDVTLGDACYDVVSHLGYLLALLALETVCHQPLANKLL